MKLDTSSGDAETHNELTTTDIIPLGCWTEMPTASDYYILGQQHDTLEHCTLVLYNTIDGKGKIGGCTGHS